MARGKDVRGISPPTTGEDDPMTNKILQWQTQIDDGQG